MPTGVMMECGSCRLASLAPESPPLGGAGSVENLVGWEPVIAVTGVARNGANRCDTHGVVTFLWQQDGSAAPWRLWHGTLFGFERKPIEHQSA
jgi:hypothetical protein